MPFLTPREVAVLSHTDVKKVHKSIEQEVLIPTSRGRSMMLGDYAVIYFAVLGGCIGLTFSLPRKRELVSRIRERFETDSTMRKKWFLTLDSGVGMDVSTFAVPAFERVESYTTAREEEIVSNPKVMGGAPCIRGTRLPVHTILGRFDAGDTIDDLVEDYPEIGRERLTFAIDYARAHPLMGRPKLKS